LLRIKRPYIIPKLLRKGGWGKLLLSNFLNAFLYFINPTFLPFIWRMAFIMLTSFGEFEIIISW
jgi:hypothetical protein